MGTRYIVSLEGLESYSYRSQAKAIEEATRCMNEDGDEYAAVIMVVLDGSYRGTTLLWQDGREIPAAERITYSV